MSSSKKKSLVLLIVGLFWASYVGIVGIQFYDQVVKEVNSQVEDRQIRMSFVQDQIFSSLIAGKLDLAKYQLEEAKKIYLIDFYILQSGNRVLIWQNNGNLKSINVDYKVFNQWMSTEKVSFRTLKAFEYRLTAGLFQDRSAIVKETAWMMRYIIVREVTSVTLALLIIVLLILKDIIRLSKIISGKNRDQIRSLKGLSAEAEALINASKGLEGERVRLSGLSETYSQTVGPAIVHEIQSGKKAPYQFQATICRIDLNGYTQLMLEKDPRYLNTILNNYFARAREAITRYGGLIYQFVGDEIVFEFKDNLSQDENSIVLATACIRDLFHQAELLEQSLPDDANHYFKLKASFAHGTMRFVSLDEGHALSGIPLVESVRLLSIVEDKASQVLTFFEDSHFKNQDLVTNVERKDNQLKGFKETSKICFTKDFRSIDWILNNQKWALLKYYRSDSDMVLVLKKMRFLAGLADDLALDVVFNNLKEHRFEKISNDLSLEAQNLLQVCIDLEKNNTISEKSLSSYISLFQRLVPNGQRSYRSNSLLRGLLGHRGFRVQANTVLAMGQSQNTVAELEKRILSNNNRLAADAIVELSKINLDKSVYKALRSLLEHQNIRHRRSGQYALKKILKHYQTKDPVFYESNPVLNSIKGLAHTLDSKAA